MTRTAKVQMPETPYSNPWTAELTAQQIEGLLLRLQDAKESLDLLDKLKQEKQVLRTQIQRWEERILDLDKQERLLAGAQP